MKAENHPHVINDGGPAFPFGQISETTGLPINGFFAPGMSLRDWFAGQALSGLAISLGYQDTQEELSVERIVGDSLLPDLNSGTAQKIADSAYDIADAMIAARSAKEDAK